MLLMRGQKARGRDRIKYVPVVFAVVAEVVGGTGEPKPFPLAI
jgi:hypothetical protein